MQELKVSGKGDSKPIVSDQSGIHPRLYELVGRHMRSCFRADLPQYIQALRSELVDFAQAFGNQLVLDSGCGTGDSTLRLAAAYPQCAVVGVDKSESRLQKAKAKRKQTRLSNVLFMRADLIHFWRLINCLNLRIKRHYLFHPNPWPKGQHLQRRWHGHSVFPELLAMGGFLELHTNWLTYAQEFAFALKVAKELDAPIEELDAMVSGSAFERKYNLSGHVIYRVSVQLSTPESGD